MQVGGAAGTLSLAATLTPSPTDLVASLASELGLDAPPAPWHTRRGPITEVADALVRVTDALGVIGSNVALLSRPEIGELAEGGHRGGSSTMPDKRNPVLSVPLRSTALQAPMLSGAGSPAAGRPDLELNFTRLAGDENSPELLVVGAGLGTAVGTLWSEAAELLADRFEVVGVDLPGHGASTTTTAEFTVADLADAIREKSAKLAGGRPAWYAGVSLAGAVALELATDPGPFTAVAAIASATTLGTPEMWAERADLVRQAGTPVMISGSVQRWFAPGFSERSPETVGQMLHDLTDTDDVSYALCCGALAAYDLSEMTTEVPVLLAPGEHDVVVNVERAELDAGRLPSSKLQVISGAAHQPPVENPKQLTEALVEFIDTTGAHREPA